MEVWRMPIEELLDKAVRHELAHALCHEKDESKARTLEERLRSRTPTVCTTPAT
jgi:predicted SprT family Zn-dependent metalloprotease